MSISFYKTVKNIGIPKKDAIKAIQNTLSKLKVKNKDVSISFVGERLITSLNRKYRKKNKSTDVLSFSSKEGFGVEDDSDWGDIFICVPIVEKQAKEQKISFKEECLRMIIHGVLHLAGYDHITKKEEKEMFGLQEKILRTCL